MTFGLLGGATPKSTSGGGGSSTVITSDDVMSEIKEIKYTIWLDEYKSFGEESHVFNNKDNWAELMQSNAALNDKTISTMAFNFLLENDINPMTAMGNIYGTGINFKQYETFKELCMDSDNVTKIIEHPVLSKIVYNHQPFANDLFDINTSGIWDIMTLELGNTICTNPAFLAYMGTCDVLSSQESVPNGYYFISRVNITGVSSSEWYYVDINVSVDGQPGRLQLRETLHGGASGCSYNNWDGSSVNVVSATSNMNSDYRMTPGDRTVNKFATGITLTEGSSYNHKAGNDYFGYPDTSYNYKTYKSTVYYVVLPKYQ